MDSRLLLLFLAFAAAQTSQPSSTLACKGGPASSCTLPLPNPLNVTINAGQLLNLTFFFPCGPFSAYFFNWTATPGITVAVEALTSTNATVTVRDQAGNGGSITAFLEWCDPSGYGSRNATVFLLPATTPTTTPSQNTLPPIPTPSPTLAPLPCLSSGRASTCAVNFNNPNLTLNAGQSRTYNFTLPSNCAITSYRYELIGSSNGVTISESNNGNSAMVTVNTNSNAAGSVTLKGEWCDSEGAYGSANVTLNIVAAPTTTPAPTTTTTTTAAPTTTTTTTTPAPTYTTTTPAPTYPTTPKPVVCNFCGAHAKASTCTVNANNHLNVQAGLAYTFTETLSCAASRARSAWTATFRSCEISVKWNSNNPTYTINAPVGSEGQGGSITTEWCDSNGGYASYTTNFVVVGSNSGSSAGTYNVPAAQANILLQGSSNSTSTTVSMNGNGAATLQGFNIGTIAAVLIALFYLKFA